MTTSRSLRCALAGLVLLGVGTAAACSAGAGGGSDGASSSEVGVGGGAAGAADGAAGGAVDAAAPQRAGARAEKAADGASGQAVISTGSVELTADDVPDARLDVLTVIARYGGQVADEQATTDADAPTPAGAPEDTASSAIARTHLVVRVPSRSFDRAMRDLAGIGHFVASSRQAKDVTTEVIDVKARVRVQAASVARIEQLLGRAEDIKDIVAVEAQLSRRQADLESLRGRAAYLADQTSLATITVDVSKRTTSEKRAESPAFVAGLSSGWHGLTALLGGALTALGALLPFLLVLLPLALVLWRLRRRFTPAPPAPAAVVPDEMAP